MFISISTPSLSTFYGALLTQMETPYKNGKPLQKCLQKKQWAIRAPQEQGEMKHIRCSMISGCHIVAKFGPLSEGGGMLNYGTAHTHKIPEKGGPKW